MKYIPTTATYKLAALRKRIRGVAGGCLAKGTKVLMYDLSYKNVEDIIVGDVLMGDDSTPRNVLKLYRGYAPMYKVQQKKGIDYTVNNKHILVLEDQGKDVRKSVDGKRIYTGREHVNGYHKFTAEDYSDGSRRSTVRRYKGIKVGLEFECNPVILDPYYLGLWLGDGASRSAYITNIDAEITDYLYNDLPKLYDVSVHEHDKVTTAIVKNAGKYNDIVQRLKEYNLILNKHIPIDYIRNSRDVRLQLLAGLIDSDGHLARDYKTKQPKGYYITQKNERLSKDILLLCRSLGYYTTYKKRVSRMTRTNGTIYECDTYVVSIFAKDYTEIPVKVDRKKCNVISDKNPLRSTISVDYIGDGDYYGFELDGNHLFLLEDFTVTHNTSAGKTISIIQILIEKAQLDKSPTITSITSESLPHLKRGCIRDFLDIMQDTNLFKESQWNRTDFTYTFNSGSKIEFFSLDMPHKVRGPRRDRLFINEANNIPKETMEQLEVRTKDEIWLDWNPTNEFWFYTDYMGRDDVDFIILTYKDNQGLSQSIIDSIEMRKSNKNWWRVYGLGQLGEVEGKIYTNWQIIDDIPHEARLVRYGLDFGYSTDPTAIVAVYEYNGGYIIDEVTYQKGLSNKQIADIIKNVDSALVMADSAEPKSIDELKLYGINVLPCVKGQGSVSYGIQYVQDQKISITKRSVNGIREYRNYMWKTDKDGRMLNIPEPGYDHFNDAVRYAFDSLRPQVKHTQHKRPQRMHFHV